MKQLCDEAGRDFNQLEITMTFLQQPELQPQDPKRAWRSMPRRALIG